MNDRTPLVSIVLPTYNRAHVLPHAIQSILGQTYGNLELIVIDDNSTDNTTDIIHSFADNRIRCYKNESNLRLPKSLNRGFSLAQGDYLTWTSDDNIFAENAIEKMVDRLHGSDCQFVYTDYYLFADLDENKQPLNIRHERLPERPQLEKSNHIGACFMYTRKVYQEIGEYDPELFLVEDYDYFIRINLRFGMCHIAEPLYHFRRNDETLYCSRFCEVKASDLLVRYKNNLLSENEVLKVMVTLLLKNIDNLKNPILRSAYYAVNKMSFRLTQAYNRITAQYLLWRLQGKVKEILKEYLSENMTFGEAKNLLSSLMQSMGTIEYRY